MHKTNPMNRTVKQPKCRVFYSVFVNGTEYPKEEDFNTEFTTKAEEELKAILVKFPETEYKIHRSERIN